MKQNPQLEFVDLRRDRARPAGGGQLVDGAFVFDAIVQRVDQVAYTIGCDPVHIYHLIQEGAFPNARDISSTSAKRAHYRIPRCDVIAYLDNTKLN
ncbi:DNA-binding protein [Verrucomicrobia bacterium S94]|nr:DNA-binding protein [Verrucomicrobia bacterium S94]